MGLRGPKPGFRDAQREHAGRIEKQGRPRYAKGSGEAYRKLAPKAAKIWQRVMEAISDSGNVREVAYPLLEEFCELAAELPEMWKALRAAREAEQWDKANQISMILNRHAERMIDISARFGFEPKSYLAMAEASTAPTGPTSIERILAS